MQQKQERQQNHCQESHKNSTCRRLCVPIKIQLSTPSESRSQCHPVRISPSGSCPCQLSTSTSFDMTFSFSFAYAWVMRSPFVRQNVWSYRRVAGGHQGPCYIRSFNTQISVCAISTKREEETYIPIAVADTVSEKKNRIIFITVHVTLTGRLNVCSYPRPLKKVPLYDTAGLVRGFLRVN